MKSFPRVSGDCHVSLVIILLTTILDGVIAYTTSSNSRAFQKPITTNLPPTLSADVDVDALTCGNILPNFNLNHQIPFQQQTRELNFDVESAEGTHGMPWKMSIGGPDAPLLYMDYWEWQLSFMKENLSNLNVLSCSSEGSASFPTSKNDFTYEENAKKQARIVNLCFASDEYRKIRMTYYDAGEGCQVFNSVWYPQFNQNLPVLGIDLLSFSRKKFLAIVDFQPLHEEEDFHAVKYEDSILKPIRDDYPSLNGKMSSKFYDETQFFSHQMLFSRFEKEDIIQEELRPAYQRYVKAHVDLVKTTDSSIDNIEAVSERQIAYDTYSAERDPATGLFASMFGKDWADEFVHGFLFSQSVKGETMMSKSPGPPATTQRKR